MRGGSAGSSGRQGSRRLCAAKNFKEGDQSPRRHFSSFLSLFSATPRLDVVWDEHSDPPIDRCARLAVARGTRPRIAAMALTTICSRWSGDSVVFFLFIAAVPCILTAVHLCIAAHEIERWIGVAALNGRGYTCGGGGLLYI